MKRNRKHHTGSIADRMIVLLIVCIALVSGAFIVANMFQSRLLTKVTWDTNERQTGSMSEFGEETIERMVTQEMNRTTELEAMVTDKNFEDLGKRVKLVGQYAATVLCHPENFSPAEWAFPDADKSGTLSAMIMLAEGVDPSDPDTAARIGLVANMSEMMINLCDTFGAENAYIGLPEGIHLAASRNAGGWYQADGTLQKFDPRERYWYKEAVEAGELIFTDVGDDKETGQLCIVCAMPVYGPDGELLGVVGSDFFLTEIQEAVQSVGGDDEFHVITNQDGQVIFSPKEDGEFRPTGDLHAGEAQEADAPRAQDLRQSENAELAAFVTDAMEGNGSARTVTLSDGTYYMAGAPVKSLGWTEISVFSQEKANEAIQTMLSKYSEIQSDAVTSYRKESDRFKLIIALMLSAELILMLGLATVQGRRIVQPLNRITKRISQIRGSDMEFEMEDAYRTGDEIEVLANAFSDMSRKTAEYVEQVRKVSAEKERISSELRMATRIQESMLPNTFPAFPDCRAVDIYASMDPAKEVGGDFYDFFFIDPDHLAIVIADVSGKGIPAALFMMISRAIIKNCAMMGKSAAQILEESNRAMCSENKLEMFVTVWIGILEVSTGRMVTANAGHEDPVICRVRDGRWKRIRDRHGFVLGGFDNIRYKEKEILMEPGDKLFIYTDGVPEAWNDKGEFFGIDRMIEALQPAANGTPGDVLCSVREAVNEFADHAEQFDDLTMLCVEYKGSGGN